MLSPTTAGLPAFQPARVVGDGGDRADDGHRRGGLTALEDRRRDRADSFHDLRVHGDAGRLDLVALGGLELAGVGAEGEEDLPLCRIDARQARAGADDDANEPVGVVLDANDDGLLATVVEQPSVPAVAAAQQPVAPAGRKAVRQARPYVLLEYGPLAQRLSTWTSTRNERLPAISSRLRPRPRLSVARRRAGRRRMRTSR